MNNQPNDMNETILKKLRVLNWTGRLLTSAALGIGLLAIAGGILLTMACPRIIFPQVQLLLKQSTAQHANSTNSNSGAVTNAPNPVLTLSDGSVVDQQTLVTLLFGKALDVMSLAIAILGLGAMLTLLLVIFNRRVTLRQVNASLAQISQQIKELQERGQKPS
ncbi:MAG TPA: hypothetical protein VNV43_13680 [Candidatus Acidoferrales bacterium]|jgi:hypothetical protein|nr:hypothetical protein [Candidatus Acidoferrales bacterium]